MRKREMREFGFELLRALAFYSLYTVLSLILSGIFILASTGIMKSLRIPNEPVYAVSTLGLVFSAYSLARAFELYDLEARRAFIGRMGERYSLLRDLAITFSSFEIGFKTIVQLLTVNAIAFIMPYQLGYGYLMASISPPVSLGETQLYLLKGAIVCPALLLIMLLIICFCCI